MSSRPLLEIDRLSVGLHRSSGEAPLALVHDVSLAVGAGEAVGLVGESGSGKSMTARAVMRLLPRAAAVGGEVRFDSADVYAMGKRELSAYRTSGVGIVFQDARSHINPVRRIGDFLTEVLRSQLRLSAGEARARIVPLLAQVGLRDPESRLRQYPHELSGGLLQRVMLAAALAPGPRLLIADEPTTALDVTTQAEVMATIDRLRHERDMALLLISHDLELTAAVCDRITVMYAGVLLEDQPARELVAHPRNPYSAGLLASRPALQVEGARLVTIPGRPLAGAEAPPYCVFADRCAYVEERCREGRPELVELARPTPDAPPARVACVRADELESSLTAVAVATGAVHVA